MSQHSFIKAWAYRLSVLSAIICSSNLSLGQANFWTIFSNSSVVPYGCSNETNRISCVAPPGSSALTPVPDINDNFGIGNSSPGIDFFKNSVYDRSGEILFSVNQNGIYAPNGDQVYFFDNNTYPYLQTSTVCGGSTVGVQVRSAISDIAIFPAPGICNRYYAVFWSNVSGGTTSGTDAVVRCVGISVLPGIYGTDPNVNATNTWYSITDDLLDDPICVSGTPDMNYFENNYMPTGGFQCSWNIAVNTANTDGSRDIYTVHTDRPGSTSASTVMLRKWHFDPNGNLPHLLTPGGTSTNATIVSSGSLLPPVYAATKVFHIYNTSTGVYDPVISYLSTDQATNSVTFQNGITDVLETYNINTGTAHEYKVPYATTNGHQDITGFEYLPQYDIFCFAYRNYESYNASGNCSNYNYQTGGLGYASSSGSTGATSIVPAATSADLRDYMLSDLKLSKSGDMYLVKADLCTTVTTSAFNEFGSSLAYIPHASLNSTFISGAVSPTTLSYTCSGSSYPLLTTNYQPSESNLSISNKFNLGNQIPDEDYDKWSADVMAPTMITSSTLWTPTNNPVANATGVPSTTITFGTDITVAAGGFLDIANGMTVRMAPGTHIDIKPAASQSGTGGMLSMEYCMLTAYDACGTPAPWGGIVVEGNPAWPQPGGVPSGNTPQGRLYLQGTELAYAECAIQTGTSAANSGGVVATLGAEDESFLVVPLIL